MQSQQSQPKFVFTGGGTAGHVIPNLAIIRELKKIEPKVQIFYVGSKGSLERKLVRAAGLQFHAVQTGKLRRYFSLKNLRDILRVPLGIWQARQLLRAIKPKAVFAKGGFVSVPVALAAASLKIPLLVHESDANLGLATRICARFARQICVSFPLSVTQKLNPKFVLTGNPIRAKGAKARGLKFLNFPKVKPIVLIVGGSSGARFLNEITFKLFPQLVTKANLVLLTGGQSVPQVAHRNFRVFDFLGKEYLDVLQAADLVVSRAGANALFEIAQAGKPSVLIPLPPAVSRGDQLKNAAHFVKFGAARAIAQHDLTSVKLQRLIQLFLASPQLRQRMGQRAARLAPHKAAQRLAEILRFKAC